FLTDAMISLISGRKLKGGRGLKKTPLGAVWGAPAGLKEAIQPPAQHRWLQLPGLRGGKTEQTSERDRQISQNGRRTLATLPYMKLTYKNSATYTRHEGSKT